MKEAKMNTPLICVPITGQTDEQIREQLHDILPEEPDVIEWRADFYEHLDSTEAVEHMLSILGSQTDIPIMFTIRSKREGGQSITLTDHEVLQLLCHISAHPHMTYLDYEINQADESIALIQKSCKLHNKSLILSYHHFQETPANDTLNELVDRAVAFGADIVKLAVMPEDRDDVLRLLHVTSEIDQRINIPVITMSMGEVGQVSRAIGWLYGSILTFAVGVESSAPGQIHIKQLRKVIKETKAVVKW